MPQVRIMLLIAAALVGFGRAKEGAKGILNGGGELAGKAATEVV